MSRQGLEERVESLLSPSATKVDHKFARKSEPVRVLPDGATSESPASLKLVELLAHVVHDDSDQATLRQHRAAMAVLEQLRRSDLETTDMSAQLESPHPIEAAKCALDVSQCPQELEACEFANLATPARSQHEDLRPNEVDRRPTLYPIPTNEECRMETIVHLSLHDILNVPELNLICSLAAAEVKCPHGIVTLVERDVVSLLAANNREYWHVGSGNPREQSFCQQFIMHDKPLLVHYAKSDPRFEHIAPVTKLNLQFYAGFPLTVSCAPNISGRPSKVIVGALCVLDEQPRDMTRAQYWRLVKLAKAASIILEKAAIEFIAETHPPLQESER